MDPIVTSIVVILGKYALDKGAELGKAVGPQALDTAREMFRLALERVGRQKPETAAEFPADPETYEKPMEKALEEQMASDPDLAAQLEALLARYDEAADAYASAAGGTTVVQHGAGLVATGHSAAATSGGIAVAGDVHGGINTSSREGEEENPAQA